MRKSDKGGSFMLSLRGTRAKSSTPQIKYGGSSQGTISDKVPRALFRFDALQGDVISIVVQSLPASRLAPYVVLLNQNGDKLADSDPTTTRPASPHHRYSIQDEGSHHCRRRVGRTGRPGAFRVTLTSDPRRTAIKYGDMKAPSTTASLDPLRF
jgi:hypothetical protein